MDQLKSNNDNGETQEANKVGSEKKETSFEAKRTFTMEFFVGLFTLIGLLALGYLSINIGGLDINSADNYYLKAEFNDVSGLKEGASVEISGVKIGEVSNIELAESKASALITLKLDKDILIQDDDIAMIRTKGIIGDRYVKFSRGASEDYLEPNSVIYETESVVDIEDIIGKLVHNFGSDESEDDSF